MKKQFIADLKAGDVVDDIFILSEKNASQKKDGNAFLTMVLSDRSGRVKGVVWENADRLERKIPIGALTHVKGNASQYRGDLQLVVNDMEIKPKELLDPKDFLPATDKNIDLMFDRLKGITLSFQDSHLRALFDAFWQDKPFVEQFKTAPGAKVMHHAYIGGLLEHTLSMTMLAEKIAGHYSGIDREMLISGAILHDVGKVRALTYGDAIDLSDEGRFLSHIVIGLSMLDEKVKTVKGFSKEKIHLLKHMIISHHGSKEKGALEPPKTIEAVLLHYIDDMDSTLNSIRHYIRKEGGDDKWTPFHRILGQHFYKGSS